MGFLWAAFQAGAVPARKAINITIRTIGRTLAGVNSKRLKVGSASRKPPGEWTRTFVILPIIMATRTPKADRKSVV